MLKNKIPDLESSSVSLAIVQNANVVSDSVGNYNDNNSDTVANNNINDQSNGGWGEGDVAYTPYDGRYGMHSDSSDGSDNEGDHNKNVKKCVHMAPLEAKTPPFEAPSVPEPIGHLPGKKK